MDELKQSIRAYALSCGADLVGFSGTDRFDETRPNVHPLSIYPRTRSVIGLGFRVLRGAYRGIEEGTTFYQYPSMGVEYLEETYMPQVLLKVASFIEDTGYAALPQRRHPRLLADEEDTDPEINLSALCRNAAPEKQMDFRESAIACGLGEIGRSGAILTNDFGPFQRFCFVLTDAPLSPDPLPEALLCDGCGACAQACYGGALTEEITIQAAGLEFPVYRRDNWQCAAYYKGANRSRNPFMPPDGLDGIPDRKDVLSGRKQLSRDEAVEVLDKLNYYGGVRYGYAPSLCGRACDRACYIALEQRGALRRRFHTPFRDREEWRLK